MSDYVRPTYTEQRPRELRFDFKKVTPFMVHRLATLMNEKGGSLSSEFTTEDGDVCLLTFHVPMDEHAVTIDANGFITARFAPGDAAAFTINVVRSK